MHIETLSDKLVHEVMIENENTFAFDLKGMIPGMYILFVSVETKMSFRKLVVY